MSQQTNFSEPDDHFKLYNEKSIDLSNSPSGSSAIPVESPLEAVSKALRIAREYSQGKNLLQEKSHEHQLKQTADDVTAVVDLCDEDAEDYERKIDRVVDVEHNHENETADLEKVNSNEASAARDGSPNNSINCPKLFAEGEVVTSAPRIELDLTRDKEKGLEDAPPLLLKYGGAEEKDDFDDRMDLEPIPTHLGNGEYCISARYSYLRSLT